MKFITKNLKFSLVLFFISTYSCISMNNNSQKYIYLSQFFDNEAIYNSLEHYFQQEEIIIYDDKKILSDKPISFGNSSKKIRIEITKPQHSNYFIVHNYTLNKNLASLILATSDLEKGIIYYSKRNHQNEKWKTMNIIPKNSR